MLFEWCFLKKGMKTNQNMVRKMGEFQVTQETIEGRFNATQFLNQWNRKYSTKVSTDSFFIDNKEFIKEMGFNLSAKYDLWLSHFFFL
jgi:hypothetical protein